MSTLKSPFKRERSFFRRWCCGWLPFWVYSGAVLTGAVLPSSEIPDFLHRTNDKVLHFCEFFVLFLVSENAFRLAKRGMAGHHGEVAYGYCIIICVITEIAQQFTKTRMPEFYDFVADVTGSGLAYLLYGLVRMQHYRRPDVLRKFE